MNIANDYDSPWKDIIEEFFEDFLLFFAEDLYNNIDFEKGYEFLEKELEKLYPDSENRKRYVDKLAKVYLKNGEEKWILVHIEVQGYKDDEFPKRMFEYFYRVHDKFDKRIFAIAIFTDDNKNYTPQKFHYDFYGTKLTYTYNTYKILGQNEDILKQSDNPFAMVVLAGLYSIKGRKNHNIRLGFKLNLTRKLLDAKWSKDKINRLFLFIDGMMQLPEGLALQFNTELKELTKKGESNMALTWENSRTYKISLLQATREAAKEAEERAMAKVEAMAEEKAIAMAEEKAIVMAEEKAIVMAEEKAIVMAEEKAIVMAEEKAIVMAEEKAKKAEERTKKAELAKMVSVLLCKKFKLAFLPTEISEKINETEVSNLEDIRDNIFDIASLEEAVNYLK